VLKQVLLLGEFSPYGVKEHLNVWAGFWFVMKKRPSKKLNLVTVDAGEVISQEDVVQLADMVVHLFLRRVFGGHRKDMIIDDCMKDMRLKHASGK